MSPEYDDKREWFFNTFSKYLQNQIRTKWYNHMNELRTDIYFFPWFEHHYEEINIEENNIIQTKNIQDVYSSNPPSESITPIHLESQIIVSPLEVTSLNNDNMNNNDNSPLPNEISPNPLPNEISPLPNEIIHKKYTPDESLSLIHKESQLVTSPLKLITSSFKTSPSDDNNIILQNDFPNTCIKDFNDKSNKIKNHINSLKIKNQEKETERLLLYETPPNLQFSFKINNTELLEEITKIPDQENKNHVSTFNHNEILNNLQEDSETELDTELVIDRLHSKDLDPDLNRIILENRNNSGIIPRNNYKGNYVTHTSIIHDYYSIIHNWYLKPPNIQFEELGIKAKLRIRNAYIDNALYNRNINDLLDYETLNILHDIIANTYMCPNKSDYQISNIISNQSIKDVLRYKKNIYKNLKHLKYLSSTNFKWYKDIFLSELLIKMNNRVSFWKERFIDYFAHKDKEKFNNYHNDCMSLTYKRIINALKLYITNLVTLVIIIISK
jgi:hypothetical protein